MDQVGTCEILWLVRIVFSVAFARLPSDIKILDLSLSLTVLFDSDFVTWQYNYGGIPVGADEIISSWSICEHLPDAIQVNRHCACQ